MRHSGREYHQLRSITIETGVSMNAAGSCLIKAGNTHVLCTASIDERTPPFLRGKNSGWVTAEYGMLPGSTSDRIQREAAKGKQGGRTVEIQRLIGRSLRAAVDLKTLGQRQIIVDCDVLQADGGTRTASITGGFVALHLACQKLLKNRQVRSLPIIDQLAAVSCGIVAGHPVLDMDYAEDSHAQADANFVMTQSKKLVEVQGSAESSPFSTGEFHAMMDLAQQGISELIDIQRNVLGLD